MDDVAFSISRERIDAHVELGWQEFQECVRSGVAYHLVSHPFALRHSDGAGYEIHNRILPRILDSGLAIFMTLNEYSRRLESGEIPLCETAPEYCGDTIPAWHALMREEY